MHDQNRVFDEAPVSAYLLILCLGLADITLVLNFDEVYLDDDSANLNDMSDDVVCVYSFKESQWCISLEITDLIFYLTNHLQILWVVEKLDIDVEVVRYLPEGINNEHHLILQNDFFQTESGRVPHEECNFTLVINTLNINLCVYHVLSSAHDIEILALLIELNQD